MFPLNFRDGYAIGTLMLQHRVVVPFALLLVLCVLTISRSVVYHDEVSLYTDIVAKSPNKARPHNNLGDALKKAGRLSEAGSHFERALELQPAYPDALNNLATIYNSSGRRYEAMQLLSQTLILDPNHLQARSNLAISYYEQGLFDESVRHYERIVEIAPASREAFFARKMLPLVRSRKALR
jgi:protein O-mannosyl-transferase